MESGESVRMIRDSVGAIAPRGAGLERVRTLRDEGSDLDPTVWRQVVNLGWLALRLEESRGGLGLGVPELCVVAEELGAALVPEPVLAVAAMLPLLDEPMRAAVLAGSSIVVPAWRDKIGPAAATARVVVSDRKISGRKILVPAAAVADAFVVTIGESAVLVERGAPGLSIALSRTQDGSSIGMLDFQDTPCVAVAGSVPAALDELALAHSAYLLGVSERAFQIALDYLGVRKQFGRFIGSFQVLQHRAAEAKIQLALSRAVLDEAVAMVVQEAGSQDRMRAAARALARVADTAMLIARETVQMHGAIGITDEHDIGLYCRKILSIYNQFGSASSHRARYLATLAPTDR